MPAAETAVANIAVVDLANRQPALLRKTLDDRIRHPQRQAGNAGEVPLSYVICLRIDVLQNFHLMINEARLGWVVRDMSAFGDTIDLSGRFIEQASGAKKSNPLLPGAAVAYSPEVAARFCSTIEHYTTAFFIVNGNTSCRYRSCATVNWNLSYTPFSASTGRSSREKTALSVFLFVVGLVFAAFSLSAQQVSNLDDPLYMDLTLWQEQGILHNLPPLRPYPVQLVEKLLAQVQSQETAMPAKRQPST